MRAGPEWVLLVMLCTLDLVAGRLRKPLNITTESRNFCLFLTWLPASRNASNVTYSVGYKFVFEKRWKEVPGCKNILKTECDLTDVLQKNYSNQHNVRVRAVYETQYSSWANLNNLTYMFTVNPSPPALHITQDDAKMMINVTLQEPLCMPMSLKIFITYFLEIKSMSNPYQKIPQIKLDRYSTIVNTSQYNGEICMAVRTEYPPASNKISEPSDSVCLHLPQQDQFHGAKLLTGLSVSLSVSFVVIIVICVFWCITNQKAKIPNVLEFSKQKCPPVFPEMPHEHYHTLTTIEHVEDASSITHLISKEDKDYAFNCGGYAARQPMQGDRLRGNDHTGESSSDGYTFSNSNKSSCDSSGVQTSGSSTEMALTLEKIQLNNQPGDINAITNTINKSLVPSNTSMRPLLDTLHVENSDDFRNVPLNTLSIGAGTDQLEYSDNDSYDSEDAPEPLSSHCTDCSTSDSYTGPKPIHSQKNCSSGYEQRGYMSRRC